MLTLQFARFCAIGGACFLAGLAVLTGLHELIGVPYLLAFAASFVVASSLGYLLNGLYTFGAHRLDRIGAARFLTVNAVLLAVNSFFLRLLVESFHMWYLTGTLILATANAPLSFAAHRLLSYRIGWWAQPTDTPSTGVQ